MRAIFGPVAGGYLVGYMEKGGLDPAQNPQHIYRTNYQGEVSGQALLSIPQQQTILQISGGVFSVTNLPFGRKPVLRLGPERQYVYYECPFCRQLQPAIKEVVARYGDQVTLVRRHFPLEAIHPNPLHSTAYRLAPDPTFRHVRQEGKGKEVFLKVLLRTHGGIGHPLLSSNR